MLYNVLPDKTASIFDVGCGTGLIGEALSKAGYSDIVGVDISQNSLYVANNKQVYKSLHKFDLENPTPLFNNDMFDVIVSMGVFTYGHVKPSALVNLVSYLKNSGFLLLVIREDYFNDDTTSFHEVIKYLRLGLVRQEKFYLDGREILILLYQMQGKMAQSGLNTSY